MTDFYEGIMMTRGVKLAVQVTAMDALSEITKSNGPPSLKKLNVGGSYR